MKTGTLVTLCLAAALAAPALAAPSATAVVQEYLTDRDTNQLTKAYARLSPNTQQHIPFAQFSQLKAFPDDTSVTPALRALTALFLDAGDTLGYQYHVVGVAPDAARVILVSARPRNALLKDSLTLKVVTVPDTQAENTPRLDLMQSVERTDPEGFSKAREAARAATSMSNLKQIALAILIYAQAHNDRLPDAGRWAEEILPLWVDPKASAAEKERSSKSLFRDPSAPEGQDWTYAFNQNLSGLPLSSLKDPANTVLVFESTTALKNAADAGPSLPRPGRHSGGSHYAFADGHVRWVPDKPKAGESQPDFTP